MSVTTPERTAEQDAAVPAAAVPTVAAGAARKPRYIAPHPARSCPPTSSKARTFAGTDRPALVNPDPRKPKKAATDEAERKVERAVESSSVSARRREATPVAPKPVAPKPVAPKSVGQPKSKPKRDLSKWRRLPMVRGWQRIPLADRRRRELICATLAVAAVFSGRLVQIQVFQAPELAAEALAGRMATTSIPANRGQITDRNGIVLATSADRYILAADQKAILGFQGKNRIAEDGEPVQDGPLGVAQLMAPILHIDRNELAAQLNGDSRYKVLSRDIDPEQHRAIKALNLQAYFSMEVTSSRIYPAGSLASTLVGFVNSEQEGQGGIEKTYDKILAGAAGTEEYERGRDGVPIPGGVREVVNARTGGDVILSIDSAIQWKAEAALNQAVSSSGAAYAMAVVKDIQTGEILAFADSGAVDANDRSNAAVAQGSHAVQDTFEPGSTGKVITMAAALEAAGFTPNSQFIVPHEYEVIKGQTISDSHKHETQLLTLTGVLATSSNVGTVKVAESIPPQTQYEYLKKFGLGEFSGLGLPGESRGKIHPWEKWDGRTRFTVAFGQGLTVNALQATNVFATIANGGVSVPNRLVLGTRDANSNEVIPTEWEPGHQVIKPETAATLMSMLEQATSDAGTASKAQIDGYRVAGKTGTAQLRAGTGWTYMASFVGVAPADNPRYVVSVFVKSPHSSIYGGDVAAPAFTEIMGFTLATNGIPQSEPLADPLPIYWGPGSDQGDTEQ